MSDYRDIFEESVEAAKKTEIWNDFFANTGAKAELEKIAKALSALAGAGNAVRAIDVFDEWKYKIFPEPQVILRFLGVMKVREIRVVILGQDPYPTLGNATGLAFQPPAFLPGKKNKPPEALDWENPKLPATVRNILRALCVQKPGESESRKGAWTGADGWKNFLADQGGETFLGKIPTPHDLFNCWTRQGVLLLNTSLTCFESMPGSHRYLWKRFTRLLIAHLAQRNDIHWMLWGENALKALKIHKNEIDLGGNVRLPWSDPPSGNLRCVVSSHPSSRSWLTKLSLKSWEYTEEAACFWESRCFCKINKLLPENKRINWLPTINDGRHSDKDSDCRNCLWPGDGTRA